MRLLRPTRMALIALVSLLWAITFGALRDFVWSDLAEGVIRLSGLNRVIRFVILLGFAILIGMLGILLFNDFWRTRFALEPMVLGMPGRGALMPTLLLPVSLFLMTLAWSYILTGARYSHWLVALGMVLLFILSTSSGISALLISDPLALLIGLVALLLLLLLFLLPIKARLTPDGMFLAVLALVGIYLVAVQLRMVEQDELAAIGLGRANVESNILLLRSLVYPFLILIGLDIANFVRQAAGWSTLIVRKRLPALVAYVGLFLLLGRLLYHYVATLVGEVGDAGWQATAPGYLGALAIPLFMALVWLLVGRVRQGRSSPATDGGHDAHANNGDDGQDGLDPRDGDRDGPAANHQVTFLPDDLWAVVERSAPWLLLAYFAPTLVIYLLLQVQGGAGSTAYALTGMVQHTILLGVAMLTVAVEALQVVAEQWPLVVGIGALMVLFFALRRARWLMALYLGLFGLQLIWDHLTLPGRLLEAITWDGSDPIYFWLTLWLAMVSGAWLLRGTLSPARAGWLFFLAMLLQLLQWNDFIEDPFSPFYAFAATGIVAFGIAWDALTAGSWANVGSRTFPRSSRIFLYVGYVLLTVTLINWALATHDLATTSQFTGDAALAGLHLLGAPMLYLFFPLVMALPPALEIE